MEELNQLYQNCWEYNKCPTENKENCDAFKFGYGAKCWLIADSYEKGCKTINDYCSNCSWYKLKKIRLIK